MDILMINGSPHPQGNTARSLFEMEKIFKEEGLQTETIHITGAPIRGCIGCGKCSEIERCVFGDIVNEIAPLFEEAKGVVIGSPVYYSSANGSLISLLDRLFYSTHFDKRMKVGAAIAVARRGGITATWDELNKYFAICGMPIATGQYWNGAHGAAPGEVEGDLEGMQQMRTLAHNMSFLIRAIQKEKESCGLPQTEEPARTNFIR